MSDEAAARRSWGRAWAVAAVAVAVLLLVIGWTRSIGTGEAPASASRPALRPGFFQPDADQWHSLSFVPVSEEPFTNQVEAIGNIASDDDNAVQITPPFSGRVTSVLVHGGERVSKGQALLLADATEVAQARSDLVAAETAARTSKAQLVVATANAERQHKLIAIGGAATRDVQQADSDLVSAQSQARANEAALALVLQRLSILQAGQAGGSQSVVRAPIAGVVTLRQVGPGQFLNATSNGNTAPIFTISDDSKVWLTAQIGEDKAEDIHNGALVVAKITGQPEPIRGHLDYVATVVDPTTRRLLVHATLPNVGGKLKANTYADLTIATGPLRQGLAIPGSAIVYEGDAAHVWIAGPNHSLAIRQIQVGRSENGMVEVRSGLDRGDHVVSAGALFIDRASKPS